MLLKSNIIGFLRLIIPLLILCNSPSDIGSVPGKIVHRDALKILILGNSITGAPPLTEVWRLGHGIAATAPQYDYVHILYNRIRDTLGYEPVMMTISASGWEHNFGTFDLSVWDTLRNFKADLILLRIGDNIQGETAVKDYLWEKFDSLLTFLLSNNDQVTFCTSSWYPNRTVDAIMRAVCEKRRIGYIDITRLYDDKSNHASSERSFDNPYVGSHPGDKGMQAIAALIWGELSRIF